MQFITGLLLSEVSDVSNRLAGSGTWRSSRREGLFVRVHIVTCSASGRAYTAIIWGRFARSAHQDAERIAVIFWEPLERSAE